MYKCTFVKYLWKDADKKRLFKTLERELELPFPPITGQEFTEDKWFSGAIERIVWDNINKQFTVKVADIKPKEGITAELLLDVAENQGWESRDQ